MQMLDWGMEQGKCFLSSKSIQMKEEAEVTEVQQRQAADGAEEQPQMVLEVETDAKTVYCKPN